MLYAVVYILLICGAVALVLWALDHLGTPQPIRNIVYVLTVVVAIVLIVGIVLGLFGMSSGLSTPPLIK